MQHYYNTTDEAIDTVKKGNTWATLVIPNNFSDALRNRMNLGRSVQGWDIDSSTVYVHQDKSSKWKYPYIPESLAFRKNKILLSNTSQN